MRERQRERQRVGATAAFGIVAASLALMLLCSALLIGSAAHSLIEIPGPLIIPTVSDLPTATTTAPATRPPATATATTPPCRAASASGLLTYVAHKPPSPSPNPTPTHTSTPTPAPCGA